MRTANKNFDATWHAVKKSMPLLIVVASVLITVALIATRPSDEPRPIVERAWTVEVMPVEYKSISPTLELFGSVQSFQDAELSAGLEAVVEDVTVRDGESVQTGDLIVILDPRDAELVLRQRQADLLELEAQSDFANRQITVNRLTLAQERELLQISQVRYDRAKELFDLGRLSRADFENATESLKRQQLSVSRAELASEESEIKLDELRARRERAEALRSQAELNVERTLIKAPFGGVISDVRVSEGDRVRLGDTLMRLQNPNAVEVRVQVPSNYTSSINDGISRGLVMPAVVDIDTGSVSGHLVRISGQTREGSGGVDSFIGFSRPPIGLRLGSTVRVLLYLPAEEGVVAVPAEAVYGRNRIYKVSTERMQRVEVERVGERLSPDGTSEVLVRSSTLFPNDRIIITKLANAADGLLVQTPDNSEEAASYSAQLRDTGKENQATEPTVAAP